MPKVTFEIEDSENGFEMHTHFDDPGRTYEQIKASPTTAQAFGLAMLEIAAMMADRYRGELKDDDGTVTQLSNDNPL